VIVECERQNINNGLLGQGAFLTTEFSKLGTLEVVRESDLSQPIKVKLLRRVKIRGGIVSPRPGHIATTW
jgi:hypothetical protein